MKRTRIILASDIHYCQEDFYGVPNDVKAEEFCEDLEREYRQDPYKALLLLGDYSLDFWIWGSKGTYLTKGVSNTGIFVEKYMKRIVPEGVALRMLAGNHEQYGEELWERLTNNKRKDHLIIDNILFIMLDTFGADLDPDRHSDGTYAPVDTEYIKELMNRFPDKKVILCAHWFEINGESEEFRRLLRENERILCLFCGHNHRSRVEYTGEETGNKPLIYTGNYSYSGEGNPVRCLRGYRELIITSEGITSQYIVPGHSCIIENVKITNEYTCQDRIEIKF